MDPLALFILAVCVAIFIVAWLTEERDQYSSDNPPAWIEVDARDTD